MTTANRGKVAEGKVAKMLTRRSASTSLVSYRLPDARSGSFQPTLTDFLVVYEGTPILLEVKEVAHDFRLKHDNFNPSQVARQRMWAIAGAVNLVVIYHSTTTQWRCLDIDIFFERNVGGSWDLRAFPVGTLEEVFLCQLNHHCPPQVPGLGSGFSTLK